MLKKTACQKSEFVWKKELIKNVYQIYSSNNKFVFVCVYFVKSLRHWVLVDGPHQFVWRLVRVHASTTYARFWCSCVRPTFDCPSQTRTAHRIPTGTAHPRVFWHLSAIAPPTSAPPDYAGAAAAAAAVAISSARTNAFRRHAVRNIRSASRGATVVRRWRTDGQRGEHLLQSERVRLRLRAGPCAGVRDQQSGHVATSAFGCRQSAGAAAAQQFWSQQTGSPANRLFVQLE